MKYRTSARQIVTLVVSLVFLAVGILGFLPGVTADRHTLHLAGPHSEAMLFGLFQVSVLHNAVHLLFGAVGLIAAQNSTCSRAFLFWGGIVYAVLLLYGIFVPHDSPANFVPLNAADNWLHAVLAIGMIALAFVPGTEQQPLGAEACNAFGNDPEAGTGRPTGTGPLTAEDVEKGRPSSSGGRGPSGDMDT
ncbi:DUF4383 domain-containing protein [Brevibacterium samyangense]|uniref:DUF4383 domain-containing protein n=1 Tax=Brevibacterium samyangense TaxID=366888 RepID=A0ABN2TM98_9MICO